MTISIKETKRIQCADYVHCVTRHVITNGKRIIAEVREQWSEDFKGKVLCEHYFDPRVGRKTLFLDPNVAWGHIARFHSFDEAFKFLKQRKIIV